SNKQIISGRKILVTETIIPHWLTKQATLAPNKTAIETVDKNQLTFHELKEKSIRLQVYKRNVYFFLLTFHELKEKSIRFAYKLAEKGVKPKQRVAILSTNCLDMVIAIHA